jgi:NAD(P)-dependent dehydrogenase (short-subunit alcohol dehydrogenase family)
MLEDKVCIVTGAGQGLGEAVATELGSYGATVVVNDLGTSMSGEGISEEPAAETAEEIRENGGEAMAHFGDVSDLEYTESLVADTLEEYGRVDGAVNFAGVLNDAISYKMTEEEWDRVIRVHLKGHFALLRPLAAHWRDAAGDDGLDPQRSFIGLSSTSVFGNVGQLNYSAAKAGVLGFTRTAAIELNRFNVRVNALIPTAYTRTIASMPEERQPFSEDEFPPEKVAPLVGYLLSDEATDITGCTLRAAGDMVGLLSDPEVTHLAYREDGWTPEGIAESFREVTGGEELDRSELDLGIPY